MKFKLPMTTSTVISLVEKALASSSLAGSISVSQSRADVIEVNISKMGKSKIVIRSSTLDAISTSFEVEREDLAFAHRPLRGMIMEKLVGVVRENGGVMI